MTTTISLDPGDGDRDRLALLTVDEAAAMLRIGRSLAYRLANNYERTRGRDGIPVIRMGSACLRVPRWALIELIQTGRVVKLDEPADES